METSKRRKLTFSEETCCFCLKDFKKTKMTVLDPNKSQTLLAVSKERADEISMNIIANKEKILSGALKLCYHKVCRSKYLHPFYNKTTENGLCENNEISSTFTRSQIKVEFDWKTKCFICGEKCSAKHRKTWSKVEGSINETSKLYSKLLDLSALKGDTELHTRLLSSKGDLVAVEARYHRDKSCLATYIAERNNNTFKTLPEQSKLEKSVAILKEEFKEKIEIEKCVFELSFLRSRLMEICKANNVSVGRRKLKAMYIKKSLETDLARTDVYSKRRVDRSCMFKCYEG